MKNESIIKGMKTDSSPAKTEELVLGKGFLGCVAAT